MKKSLLIILIILSGFSTLMSQSKKKSHFIKPINFANKTVLFVLDKKRSYYSLDDNEPSTIIVQGPCKVRVITRALFETKQKDNVKYTINYTIDGGDQNTFKSKSIKRSDKATFLDDSSIIPGNMDDFEIELGRGSHTIDFYLNENEISVTARFQYVPIKMKKQQWISYSPSLPMEPVDLISRESSVKYYRFTNENPLSVEINGPTELRVLTRIENHFKMKGRINYRMQVLDKGKIINTYQLSSRRSEIAVYKDDYELIPGKACEFVIDVPKGRHNYQLILLDKDKNSVLGRFLMPKNDVNLVE